MNNYGYQDDEVKSAPFGFGLNAGAAKLKKFEYITNGGAGGTEGEAVDIVFDVNGRDVSCRKFPVKKVYNKEGVEFTSESTEEAKKLFRAAYDEFNAWMVALLKCYVPAETIQRALATPINSFKDYIGVLRALFPQNTSQISLDIFMEYQWQISGENNRTFLQVPNKTKQGKFICAAVPAAGGSWKSVVVADPDDKERRALKYVDGAGNEHPFTRTGWYMNSKYANMQEEGKEEEAQTEMPANAMGTSADAGPTDPGAVW